MSPWGSGPSRPPGPPWVAFALMVAACGAAPSTGPEIPESTQVDAPVRYRVREVATGATFDLDELSSRLAEVRVVYVGERHDQPMDHAVQHRVLDALRADGRSVAVGFEMFRRSAQPALDRFEAGELDHAGLRDAVDWEGGWGFDYAFYRPLIDGADPPLALNAESEVSRTIAREGLDALDEAQRESLPELDLDVASHRTRLEALLREHPGVTEEVVGRYYLAQVVWDETMADTSARFLTEHPDARLLVVAGRMHVLRDAIPARVARRLDLASAIVLPVDDLDEEQDEAAFVDYVVAPM